MLVPLCCWEALFALRTTPKPSGLLLSSPNVRMGTVILLILPGKMFIYLRCTLAQQRKVDARIEKWLIHNNVY